MLESTCRFKNEIQQVNKNMIKYFMFDNDEI